MGSLIMHKLGVLSNRITFKLHGLVLSNNAEHRAIPNICLTCNSPVFIFTHINNSILSHSCREISMKLKTVLEPDAHSRWERISLVNKSRAEEVAEKVFQAISAGSRTLDDGQFQRLLMASEDNRRQTGTIQFLRKNQLSDDSDDDDL